MSVYSSPRSPYWLYDFKRGKARFSGSFNGKDGHPKITLERPKREAERAEAIIRASAGQSSNEKPRIELTQAFSRYWNEAAKDFADSSGEWGRMAHMERILGAHLYIDNLSDARLSDYVARRRLEKARHKQTLVSPSTINRELETLGRVLKRCRKPWGYEVPADLSVNDHKLKEPRVRIRSLSTDEDQALFTALDKLRPDFRDMVEFALLTGKRLSEVIFLEKRSVDRKAKEARVIQKGGQEIVIALTKTTLAIVERNWLHHPTRLFTYVCTRNRRCRDFIQQKGARYPFTADGWRKPWKQALTDADLVDFRFHDLRHTAATRILSATGNLKAVQSALSHSSIVSTARYAHTETQHTRSALESAESLRVPKKAQTAKGKSAKVSGKSKR